MIGRKKWVPISLGIDWLNMSCLSRELSTYTKQLIMHQNKIYCIAMRKPFSHGTLSTYQKVLYIAFLQPSSIIPVLNLICHIDLFSWNSCTIYFQKLTRYINKGSISLFRLWIQKLNMFWHYMIQFWIN